MPRTPYEHIMDIFRLRAHNDGNSITLANTLNKDIRTSFVGQHKFIFELLQNADDASSSQNNVDVTVTLLDHHLIFSHSGQHFSPEDVDRLCDNAQQKQSGKASDLDKTGYKGIGFKSIFSMSDCVYIRSHDYSFRFDKNYREWREAPSAEPYPWPIIPIWTEESDVPDEVKSYLDIKRVNFIVRHEESKTIREELQFIENNPRIILFLRHIRAIQFEIPGERKRFAVQTENIENIKKLWVNQTLNSSWLVSLWPVKIPQDIQEKLQRMSDFECPMKLKSAKQIGISLAAALDKEGHLIGTENSLLYCYLPTQIDYALPYLVNTDFLLNADRSALLDNAWNAFLLSWIACVHFSWLRQLAGNPLLRDQVLSLLGPSQISSPYSQLESAYANGFLTAQKKVAFIPSALDPSHLLTISESIVDQTRFFQEFPEITDEAYPRDHIVRYEIEKAECLAQLGGRQFNYPTFYANIDRYGKQLAAPTSNYRLMKFLDTLEASGIKDSLATASFILSSSDTLAKPREIYFQTQEIEPFLDILHLNFVHPVLQEDGSIRLFLTNIGVKEANRIEIIRNELIPSLCNATLSVEHNITTVRFIFETYLNEELRTADFTELKNSKLLMLWQGRHSAKDCYCPTISVLESQLPIEMIPNGDTFISRDYIRLGDSLEQWENFFRKMGVRGFIEGFIPTLLGADDTWLLSHTIACVRFLFQSHQLNLLQEEDYKKLRGMRVLTQNQDLNKACRIYLSNAYQPEVRLETIVKEYRHLFVSEHYVTSDSELQEWKAFLTRIGIGEGIRFRYKKEYWYKEAMKRKDERFIAYCQAHDLLDATYPEDLKKRDYVLQEFIDCDFLSFLAEKEIYDAFWKYFSAVWNENRFYPFPPRQSKWFGKKEDITWRSRRGNWCTRNNDVRLKLESPLQWGLRTNPSVRGTDGRLYRTTELYAPKLKKMIGDIFIVADIIVTDSQAQFLGFKTDISIEDCLVILDALMTKDPKEVSTRYILILKRLLNTWGRERLKDWPGRLLADNNSWQPVRSLRYLDTTQIRLSSPLWLKPVLDTHEMLKICSLFGIPIVTAGQEQILYNPTSEDERLIGEWRKHIKRNLAILIFILSHESFSVSITQKLNTLLDKLALLDCKPALSTIEIEWVNGNPDSIQRVGVYIKERTFYFVGTWLTSITAKRAMSELLGKYLQLGKKEAEIFQLLMGMNWSDITEWLGDEKRYGDKELQELLSFTASLGTEADFRFMEAPLAEPADSPFLQRPVERTPSDTSSPMTSDGGEDTFDNPVNPLTLDMRHVVLHSKQEVRRAVETPYSTRKAEEIGLREEAQRQSSLLTTEFRRTTSPQPKQPSRSNVSIDTNAVGRWGELAVYEKLKQHFQSKCQTYQLEEGSESFQLKGTTKKGEPFEVEVIWINKQIERGDPYDLIVRKNGKELFIEVKTTTHGRRTEFKFSRNEYRFMLESKENHRVFFLFNAGKSEGVYIEKIKNLANKIREGVIIPSSLSLTITESDSGV